METEKVNRRAVLPPKNDAVMRRPGRKKLQMSTLQQKNRISTFDHRKKNLPVDLSNPVLQLGCPCQKKILEQ